MNTALIEPTDLLFFRDAVPMSAGQGKGAGCRMPFPSTLHEAFRASLLTAYHKTTARKHVVGRPRTADRKGNWHEHSPETDVLIASKAYQSLRTAGPLPFLCQPVVWEGKQEGKETGVQVVSSGLLWPVALDVAFETGGATSPVALRTLQLLRHQRSPEGAGFHQPCLPVAVTPPDKHGQLRGWWTTAQFAAYLSGEQANTGHRFRPIPQDQLWQAEYRVGVQIDPGTFAAESGQLYAGSYLRPHAYLRFACQVGLKQPVNGEEKELNELDWLLLGGEQRIAHIWHSGFSDPFASLAKAPEPPSGDRPFLLKWVLATPAIFAHGSLPGWCADTKRSRSGGPLPNGRVCLDLPGAGQLISWCIGKPLTVSGWDVVEQRAKPTRLAVPAGSVFYFLCENRATAAELARKLHWQPRSDFYGEKGCGYGLVSFDVEMHRSSSNIKDLAGEVFA
jgi:CRISPR-associated protein Cmr3